MLERLNKLVHPILGDKSISLHEDTVILRDLGINSYDVVELICLVEDEFDISIPDKKIKTFITIGDLIKYIEAQG